MAGSQLRVDPPGSFIELADGRTYYELAGPENGEPVVLVHGFSVPSYIWEPTVPALLQAGLRVLRYDLFGRGHSDRPRKVNDLNFFIRQLSELLAALKISLPINLVGLSMGGPIAAGYTARRPDNVRRLVLIDPAGLVDWLPTNLRLLRLPGIGEALMALFGESTIVNGQSSDFYRPERFPGYGELARPQIKIPGYRRSILSTVRHGPLGDLSALYQQIGAAGLPVLLVWGREDQTFPFELSAKALKLMPQAKLRGIGQAGHIPHYEQPEEVNPILVEFLKRRS